MDAIYTIRQKIAKYQKQIEEISKLKVTEYSKRQAIDEVKKFVTVLEYLVKEIQAGQQSQVLPLKGMKIRTKEEIEEFHLGLIKKMTSKVLAGCCDHIEYIKNMNQYFVTITSLLWCSGQIEKFERLERILNYGSLKEAKEYLDSCLHELFTQHSILSDNNDILEKELGI